MLESAVLSGLGTGEHPDEGHGPDAAAGTGAGDRGRPPQGRGRPLTGIAGGKVGAAGSGAGGWGGGLPWAPYRVAAENVQASLQPLEIARDLRASLFCLGGEPTCPKT